MYYQINRFKKKTNLIRISIKFKTIIFFSNFTYLSLKWNSSKTFRIQNNVKFHRFLSLGTTSKQLHIFPCHLFPLTDKTRECKMQWIHVIQTPLPHPCRTVNVRRVSLLLERLYLLCTRPGSSGTDDVRQIMWDGRVMWGIDMYLVDGMWME